MAIFYPFPYPSVGSMDLTVPYTIFNYRASCPGSGACSGEDGSYLIIGDSLTNQICDSYRANGRDVLKFGVNGMKAHDLVPWCDMIVQTAKPKVIVVALGKNDMGAPGNLDTGLGIRWYFQQDYWWLAAYLAQSSGKKPVLMTIPPPVRGAPGLWGDMELIGWGSDYIKAVGAAQGLQVVDFRETYPDVDPIVTDGPYLTPGFCSGDPLGVHPYGASIKKMWAYYELALQRGLVNP